MIRMLSLSLAALFSCAGLQANAATSYAAAPYSSSAHDVVSSEWSDYQSGQEWLQKRLALMADAGSEAAKAPVARNLIFFLGDGMSVTTLTAGRIFQGQQQGKTGEEHFLAFEQFPHSAVIKTYNTNQQTPDSAGTMTALMTGVKTRAGAISVGPEQPRSICSGSDQHRLKTLFEWAEAQGYATGVVTNARITHATPAATYAHSPERNWEGVQDLPQEAIENGCVDIASQLVDKAFPAGLDVALGGGGRSFGEPLRERFRSQVKGSLVTQRDQLLALNPNDKTPVLGLFSRSHMAYAYDRQQSEEVKSAQPSLPEMADFALKRLQALTRDSDKGFILVIEGARIDHAHHLGNAYRALTETSVLGDTVAQVRAATADDTLMVVTADHSHTLSMAGYPQRGNPILGLVKNGELTLARDSQPYTTLGYANGVGAVSPLWQKLAGQHNHTHTAASAYSYTTDKKQRQNGRFSWMKDGKVMVDTENPDFCQTSLARRSSETHGSDDVALHAEGPGAERFHGLLEQHSVYHLLRLALGSATTEAEFAFNE